MPIQIEEILRRSDQGVTLPFICRGEDEQIYFVKGHGAGRRSLLAEYICGKLAISFGLPIADFAVVDIPAALIKASLLPDISDLGQGLAFGSRSLPHVQELLFSQLSHIDTALCKDIVMFDWWIQNSDRTLSVHGGNPNLLWDQSERRVVIIDHNTAFEHNFNKEMFWKTHIFSRYLENIFSDMVERESYCAKFQRSLADFDLACDSLPDEWWWAGDGVPAQFDRNLVKASLSQFNSNSFWSIT